MESLEKIWDEYQVYNNDEINLADHQDIQLTEPKRGDKTRRELKERLWQKY